jgi:hypothetical protein
MFAGHVCSFQIMSGVGHASSSLTNIRVSTDSQHAEKHGREKNLYPEEKG